MAAQSRTCRRSSSILSGLPGIACSASRLNSTRSGIVSEPARLPGFTLGLSDAAPIPPLALLGWQPWVAGLSHRGGEYVEAADVVLLVGQAAQLVIHVTGFLSSELGYAVYPQNLEVADHRGAYRHKVSKPALS